MCVFFSPPRATSAKAHSALVVYYGCCCWASRPLTRALVRACVRAPRTRVPASRTGASSCSTYSLDPARRWQTAPRPRHGRPRPARPSMLCLASNASQAPSAGATSPDCGQCVRCGCCGCCCCCCGCDCGCCAEKKNTVLNWKKQTHTTHALRTHARALRRSELNRPEKLPKEQKASSLDFGFNFGQLLLWWRFMIATPTVG